jgi:hypothetical protein
MRYKLLLPSAAILMASVCLLGQDQQQPPPAAQSDSTKPAQTDQPVTGKTSERGPAVNTSTTGTAGVETPGVLTDNGEAQRHGKKAAAHPPQKSKPHSGAPPNWEQVGQQPAQADRAANAASRAEVGGPQGTLGVKGAVPPEDRAAAARDNSAKQKSTREGNGISASNKQQGHKAKPKHRSTSPAAKNQETEPQPQP